MEYILLGNIALSLSLCGLVVYNAKHRKDRRAGSKPFVIPKPKGEDQ